MPLFWDNNVYLSISNEIIGNVENILDDTTAK